MLNFEVGEEECVCVCLSRCLTILFIILPRERGESVGNKHVSMSDYSQVKHRDNVCFVYNKTIVYDNDSIKHLILLGINSIKQYLLHKFQSSAYLFVIFMYISVLKLRI